MNKQNPNSNLNGEGISISVEFYTQELHAAIVTITQEEFQILKETSVLSANDPADKVLMQKLKKSSTIKKDHPFFEINSFHTNPEMF